MIKLLAVDDELGICDIKQKKSLTSAKAHAII